MTSPSVLPTGSVPLLQAIARAAGCLRWLAALLVCLGGAVAGAAEAAGPLDGVTVSASFSDKAGKKQGDDTLVFAGGKLDAPGLRKAYAFEPAAYTADKGKDGTITFTATLTSTEHGSLAISGKIMKKKDASGTRTWSKPGKDPIEHAFTGSAKK